METQGFITTAHAKCILAGEHAVLRGHPALVFPVKSNSLQLQYQPGHTALKADFQAPYGENLLIFLWKIIAICMEMLHKDTAEIHGQFFLKNSIPMGCGLGFSSAICVAITQWLIWQGWLPATELFNFARRLEDNFHGKSSGVDIAGSLSPTGVFYNIQEGAKNIQMLWQPKLYLSASEHFCSTEKCIRQVEKIRLQDPVLADYSDKEMAASTLLAKQALASDSTVGLEGLTEAMQRANLCFQRWGLITPGLDQHMQELTAAGALAVKPTGSGGGGYVLSLWRDTPPASLTIEELLPVF